jgi:hypothetical protein
VEDAKANGLARKAFDAMGLKKIPKLHQPG